MGVHVGPEEVDAFELGEGLADLKREALCWAIYHEGLGVIVVPEKAAGEGVRFARKSDARGAGTPSEQKYRQGYPTQVQLHRRRLACRDFQVAAFALHGPRWWLRDGCPDLFPSDEIYALAEAGQDYSTLLPQAEPGQWTAIPSQPLCAP